VTRCVSRCCTRLRRARLPRSRRCGCGVCSHFASVIRQALLGGEEEMLARRCRGGRSDNTSLLRLLEYPPLEGASEGTWGVSAHTDYEVFSLLHQDRPGLQLRGRGGGWLSAPHSAERCCFVLVGDMLERLSAGYFAATPHRVLPTPAGQRARRSFVYFQAFDEEEPVSATTLAGARRTPVSAPFLAWLEALPEQARRRFAHPVTQREWTEAKDSAASAALAECGVG